MFGKKVNIDNHEANIENAVEDFRKGSAEAFQVLYRKYSQKVYRFCLRILVDEQAAKDAYQETFVKVYENRENFKGDNFNAWLFTIARHNCLNYLRRKKDFDSYDESHNTQTYTNEHDVMLKEHIQSAIDKLPIVLKEALVLREYEDCSYQEIADILEIELSLAKIRVHRARLLLRKILEPIVREINESR